MRFIRTATAFLFLWVINAELLVAQNQNSVEGDRQALVDLYNATNGDNWDNNSGWLNGNPSNDWYGIEVDPNGRVISIKLNGKEIIGQSGVIGGNNLIGSLPESIGNLKQLKYLNLKQNKITGIIPTTIGNLTNLTHLLLNGRVLEWSDTQDHHPGKPPGGSWANERTNNFTGELPSSIGNLRNLQYLEISGTGKEGEGLDGNIPSSIGNLTDLKGLHLGFNRFISLPSSLGNLVKMINLALNSQGNHTGDRDNDDNFLAGEGFPQWINNMTDLRYLWLQNNRDLGGNLPSLEDLSKLRIFLADFNGLTGSIPQAFVDGTMPEINMVQLAWNNLTGQFPEVTGINNIAAFTVVGNDLTGKIPDSFWSITKMINTDFSFNNFNGSVKPNLNDLWQIRNLRWRENNLTGQWPDLDWTNKQGRSKHPLTDFTRVEFSNNKYVFSDMLVISDDGKTLFQWYKDWIDQQAADGKTTTFNYAPQKKFGTSSNKNGSHIDFSGIVTHEDNRYTWFKDGQAISGESTARIDASNYGLGTYKLEVTNPNVSDLTLESVDIEVTDFESSGSDDTNNNDPAPPDTPSPLNPDNNSTNVSVTPAFEWSDTGADSYRFQLDKLNSVITVADESVAANTFTVPEELDYQSDYQWRVKAVKDGVESEWSSYWEFRTQEEPLSAPGAPVLTIPDADAVNISINPSFGWETVADADSYRLQVAESSDFNNPVTDLENVSGTSFQAESLNYETIYFWRVQAVNEAGGGDWSEVRSFQTETEPEPLTIPGEPELLSPESGATGLSRSPSLSWSEVTDAASYRVQVSATQTFESLTADVSGIGGTGVNISGLDFETEYFWRVRAVNEAGSGNWSESRSFTTLEEPLAEPGVPVLVSPGAGATDVSRSPLLDWDVAANAATYRLQVSTSQEFETLETEVTDIFDSQFSVSDLNFETIYYWRVKAVNETGESAWSQTRLFTTLEEPLSAPSSPGLLRPESNSTDVSRSPELSWSAPADAETYRVQVSETAGFGSPVLDLNNVSETRVVAQNLNYSTTYFWRVLAANDAGQSSWSESRTFTTREQPLQPPSVPQLVSPQSGSEEISSINHTFTWSDSDRAESYRLQLSVGNNSFSPSIDIENISDISRTIEGLEPETTYLWRVQARNGAGSSEWSEIWFFVTDEAAPAPSLPLANSTNVELTPSFSWNNLNADEYILQVNRANTGETVIEESVADTVFTVSSELSPLTVYRWRVKALTDSLEGDWGPSIAFTTGTGNPDGDSGNGGGDDDNGDEDGNDGEDGPGDNRDEEITTIEQNYPNPFNPSTVIQFRLAEAQQVSLKIYNLAGQRVATLVSEPLAAGTHSRVFDAAGLASGIYFYRLITERNVFTKKMTLIK